MSYPKDGPKQKLLSTKILNATMSLTFFQTTFSKNTLHHFSCTPQAQSKKHHNCCAWIIQDISWSHPTFHTQAASHIMSSSEILHCRESWSGRAGLLETTSQIVAVAALLLNVNCTNMIYVTLMRFAGTCFARLWGRLLVLIGYRGMTCMEWALAKSGGALWFEISVGNMLFATLEIRKQGRFLIRGSEIIFFCRFKGFGTWKILLRQQTFGCNAPRSL